MPSLNKTLLIGHLGKDPELKYTPSGHACVAFSLATNRKWKDKDGNKQEDTTWHNIKMWGKVAEVIQQYFHKGDCIYLEGRIDNRKYEQDGQTKYFSEVVCDTFQFMGKNEKSDGGSTQAQFNNPNPQPTPGNGDDMPF